MPEVRGITEAFFIAIVEKVTKSIDTSRKKVGMKKSKYSLIDMPSDGYSYSHRYILLEQGIYSNGNKRTVKLG
jgi:hypothetical protein